MTGQPFQPVLDDDQVEAARSRVRDGETLRAVARDLGVAHTTLARRIAKLTEADQDEEMRAALRQEERAHYRRHGATNPEAKPGLGGRPEDADTYPGEIRLVEVTDPATGQTAVGLDVEDATTRLYQRGGAPPPKPLPPDEDGRPRGDAPFVWRDSRFPGGVALCFEQRQAPEVFTHGGLLGSTIRFSKVTALEALQAMAAEGNLLVYPSDADTGRFETFVPAAAHPRGYRARAVVVLGCSNELQVGHLARRCWNRVHRPRRGGERGEWLTERERANEQLAQEIEQGLHDHALFISKDGITTVRKKRIDAEGWILVPDDPAEERRIRERLRVEAGVDELA